MCMVVELNIRNVLVVELGIRNLWSKKILFSKPYLVILHFCGIFMEVSSIRHWRVTQHGPTSASNSKINLRWNFFTNANEHIEQY